MSDILITGFIILIIGMAVAPFFLLSSAFGAPKRARRGEDRNDGPVTPVPTDGSGPFPGIKKKADPDGDGAGDSDGSGGDGGGGAD